MDLKLCDSDFKFMTLIWDNEPLFSRTLVKIANEKYGWQKSTTYTELKKMTERGFAENKNSIVSSLISSDDVRSYMAKCFVEANFGGSLDEFLKAYRR